MFEFIDCMVGRDAEPVDIKNCPAVPTDAIGCIAPAEEVPEQSTAFIVVDTTPVPPALTGIGLLT